MTVYYKLLDLDTVAKDDGKTTYIFDSATGKWEVDRNQIVADRLHATDGESIGNCEQISQIEAQSLIGYEEDGTE
jgi:hypothetical protein